MVSSDEIFPFVILHIYRFANDKLLPNDCLNILCVMKFRGSEVTTSGTSRPTSTVVRAGHEAGEAEENTEENENQGLLDLLNTGFKQVS